MTKRIENAKKQYNAKEWHGTEAAFYLTDINECIDISGGGRVLNSILTALEAGFMIGYRKGRKDARMKRKQQTL